MMTLSDVLSGNIKRADYLKEYNITKQALSIKIINYLKKMQKDPDYLALIEKIEKSDYDICKISFEGIKEEIEIAFRYENKKRYGNKKSYLHENFYVKGGADVLIDSYIEFIKENNILNFKEFLENNKYKFDEVEYQEIKNSFEINTLKDKKISMLLFTTAFLNSTGPIEYWKLYAAYNEYGYDPKKINVLLYNYFESFCRYEIEDFDNVMKKYIEKEKKENKDLYDNCFAALKNELEPKNKEEKEIIKIYNKFKKAKSIIKSRSPYKIFNIIEYGDNKLLNEAIFIKEITHYLYNNGAIPTNNAIDLLKRNDIEKSMFKDKISTADTFISILEKEDKMQIIEDFVSFSESFCEKSNLGIYDIKLLVDEYNDNYLSTLSELQVKLILLIKSNKFESNSGFTILFKNGDMTNYENINKTLEDLTIEIFEESNTDILKIGDIVEKLKTKGRSVSNISIFISNVLRKKDLFENVKYSEWKYKYKTKK